MPITTTQAAQETGIPKRTIIAAITRGDLPAQKLPGLTGAYLLARDDLNTWLDSRRSKAAS
jgi:excisionase family DNA binding protein